MDDDTVHAARAHHPIAAMTGPENAMRLWQGLACVMLPDPARITRRFQLTPASAGLGAFLFVLGAGIWAAGHAPGGVYYDDGIYLILGRALAGGEGLRYLNLPGLPAATHYPPLYPAVLALCWRLGGDLPAALALAKGLNVLLLAGGTGLLTVYLAKAGAEPLVAALGLAAGAIATPLLSVTTVPFSEPLFLFGLALAAGETARAQREGTPARLVVAGVMWGALFLVRSIGIVAIPVGLALLLRRRGWSSVALSALATILVIAPWILWSSAHAHEVPGILAGSYGSYAGWYSASLQREGLGLAGGIAAHNLGELLRPLHVLLGPPLLPALRWLVIPGGVVLLAIGGCRLARLAPFLAGFLAAYLVVVVAWPYPPDRFIWGVWPLVTATFALGILGTIDVAGQKAPRLVVSRVLLLCGALSGLGYLAREGAGLGRKSWQHSQAASATAMEPAVHWVRAHVPDSAVVATVNDPLLYLYSGRRSIPVLSWSAAEYLTPQTVPDAISNLEGIMDAYHPAYVILPGGGTPEAYAAEALWKEKGRLELIDTLAGGGAVFAPLAP
jgi:hypothetical protein